MSTFEQNFWREYQRFFKTPLVTELPHPETAALSNLAQTEPEKALRLLFSLDLKVLEHFKTMDITGFKNDVQRVLKNQGRIFLVGCGASGRMAMQLEYLYHDAKKVKAIMAGGDIALIESVEGCEDVPEFAVRQLQALNLNADDLVIGLSASGEAAFIAGALEYALQVCTPKPWLLCCNAQEILLARNPQHVLKKCTNLYLDVGPMALTGSTRMQATTIMTLALLKTFFADDEVALLLNKIKHLPYADLAKFVAFEAGLYEQDKKILYQVAPEYGLSVLADLTERAPTFNVENLEWARMAVIKTQQQKEALEKILLRPVEALNWQELLQTKMDYLQQFNLSETMDAKRACVEIKEIENDLVISYADQTVRVEITDLSLAFKQLLLRLILVNHSTLVFGRLGFYQGNLMTFVKPSNFKLVDRAVRYIQFLAQIRYHKQLAYQEIAEFILQKRGNLSKQTSIVEHALKYFNK
jgi:N-acetylmuramic acid 6-phosphate etherase